MSFISTHIPLPALGERPVMSSLDLQEDVMNLSLKSIEKRQVTHPAVGNSVWISICESLVMSTCLFSAIFWEFSVNLLGWSQKYNLFFKPKGEPGSRGPLPTCGQCCQPCSAQQWPPVWPRQKFKPVLYSSIWKQQSQSTQHTKLDPTESSFDFMES